MGKFSRREFINIAALSAGGAIGTRWMQSPGATAANVPAVSAAGPDGRVPTICEICFWQCAGWTHTQNGQPWKITGNIDDPNCQGRFCPRGTGGIGAYLDEERLKTPLIRTSNKRGEQTFREATWDEALDKVAENMQQIAEKYGPEAMALFSHGSGGSWFKTLWKAYGSPNATAPSYAQCRGPREEGYYATYGEGIASPERTDLRNAKCIVLIGSHLGENMHNMQVQEFADAIGNGASVITVDPRYSTAASKSKFWLPIRPATDMALLLAWIHVIIEEELYDKAYVEQYTHGLDQLRESVAENTPEWAYPITTIKPDVIRETAREMARMAPATIVHPGRHVTWYGDDTQRVRAGAIINALLGSWGRRGGFYYPNQADVPGYPHPEYPKPNRAWQDAHPNRYPLAGLTLANTICDATIPSPERDWSIKGWMVYGTNLMMTLPDPRKTMKALQQLDFMVAIDIMPAEITGWADVVLPECSYLERYDDLRMSSGRVPSVALRAPAFEPRWDSKPGSWMVKELAKRLNLSEYFAWNTIEEYLDTRLQGIGSSLDEMKEKGVILLKDRYPIYFEDGIVPEFDTPSGKIELYSDMLAAYGFDPVPRYTRHPEPPEGYYRLIYGRAPMHTFGRTTNNPILTEVMAENTVWVSPKIAELHGIEPDTYVDLVNQDGARSNRIKVRITERIRHDAVYMVHGFGHSDKRMKRSYNRGANDTGLITRVHTDPLMGGTGMRGNFVTFAPPTVGASDAPNEGA
jgi:thiosulfate reductase / polysulfide reductase chain A